MIKSVITRNKQRQQCESFWIRINSPRLIIVPFAFISIRHTIYRNKERKDMIFEPGSWDKGTERYQDLLSQCHHAQLQVSPRTVTSVTTHSVTTHNKGYKCHHAQQGRRNSENLSGPILPHPVIHPHSLHLHQTQSTGTREEHGDRLVKQRDRKRTKICEKRRKKSVITHNKQEKAGRIFLDTVYRNKGGTQ